MAYPAQPWPATLARAWGVFDMLSVVSDFPPPAGEQSMVPWFKIN